MLYLLFLVIKKNILCIAYRFQRSVQDKKNSNLNIHTVSASKASPILGLKRYETKLFGLDRNSIKFEVVKGSAIVS